MIDSGYPWTDAFQLRLLAFLLKDPEKVLNVVEPAFFTDPITTDIATVIRDIHKHHEDSAISISKTTLKELVRGSLGKKQDEHWPLYRKIIRKLYKTKLKDKEILLDEAKEFAREHRYRNALVKAERDVTAKKYEGVHKIFERLLAVDNSQGDGPWKWEDLPRYRDFPLQNVEWLVEGILPAGSIIALSGDEGVGKTLFALRLAQSLTEGISDFLGRQISQRDVLYLGLDVSQVTLQAYVAALGWQPNRHFRFMTMWTGEDKQPPMLDDVSQIARLYELVREVRPVIIFDTLRDFFDGEENSSTDTKPVLDVLRKLRALGATIILLTHPPKKGNSTIRGTGNIAQKVDILYFMENKESRERDVVVLTCPKKNRFGDTRFRLAVRYQFVPIPGRRLRILIAEVQEPERVNKSRQNVFTADIVRYVKDHPGANQKAIMQGLNLGDRKLKEGLSEAGKKGLLKVKSGKAKELLWYVTKTSEGA
jgi:archaellum biogenesis ATPase FlaH